MITRPLDLQVHLAPVPRDFDYFAWVNVALIALCFGLLGSRFVLAPGVVIGVGESNNLELPQVVDAPLYAGPATVVVSYRRDDVILFEGGMYRLSELRKHLQNYVRLHPGAVMLVRSDRQVSMQKFLDLCEMARELGFSNVVAAAEKPLSVESAR